ncbi:MAG: hypothetical protein ACNFW9_01025 [Candidatus Kerfeldbacteria bacterium]
MPRHAKKIRVFTNDGEVTGHIVGFEKNSRTIIIKPIDPVENGGKDDKVYISFDDPAEKVR